MAIADIDGVVAGFGVVADKPYLASLTPQAAGCYMSLWTLARQPGAGATPTSTAAGEIPTDGTSGAFLPFTNPSNPTLSYLGAWSGSATIAGTLHLYDRLWQNSGLSATTTTALTVNSTALDRPSATGDDVELWWECYATMGSGAGGTQTAQYTNTTPTGSRTATLQGFAVSAAIGRCYPFTLQAGDTGINSIQSFTHTTTYTSGTYGLTMQRRIASAAVSFANGGFSLDAFALGMPRIYDNACLNIVFQGVSATAMTLSGKLDMIQG